MAEEGTLFLDEIGDLSPNAQTKLLRFLETGEIQKVGSQKSKIVDVRLIAATSRNLEEEIKRNRFRPDLYYRLNVVNIQIPALRDRKEDIPRLFEHFVKRFCVKFNEKLKDISPEVNDLLKKCSWPGNIRELRNIAEKAVIYSTKTINGQIVADLLTSPIKGLQEDIDKYDSDEIIPLKEYKNKMEIKYLQKVLNLTNGSVTKAAEMLGIDRTYLYQKLNQFKIKYS